MELFTNRAYLSGTFQNKFEYSHEFCGEVFLQNTLSIERNSGAVDNIPVVVSEHLISDDVSQESYYLISGSVRTFNKHGNGKSKTLVYVFADDIVPADTDRENLPDANEVSLIGYICKEPQYRKTPLKREITDFILAVNRPYGKSDYVPCISWGRNARFVGGLKVGDYIRLTGRIQSRDYLKTLDSGETVTKTAYEVSASQIELLDKGENENE